MLSIKKESSSVLFTIHNKVENVLFILIVLLIETIRCI